MSTVFNAPSKKDRMDEQFIEDVQSCPHLYDKSNVVSKKNKVKNTTWDQIGKEYGINGEAAKKKFRNLRKRYDRIKIKAEKHEKSGSGEHFQPHWYELMDKMINPGRTSSNILKSTPVSSSSTNMNCENRSGRLETPSTSSLKPFDNTQVRKPDSSTAKATKKQKMDGKRKSASDITGKKVAIAETQPVKDGNIHAFCALLEQEMIKMPENTRRGFKATVMKMLQQERAISLHTPSHPK